MNSPPSQQHNRRFPVRNPNSPFFSTYPSPANYTFLHDRKRGQVPFAFKAFEKSSIEQQSCEEAD